MRRNLHRTMHERLPAESASQSPAPIQIASDQELGQRGCRTDIAPANSEGATTSTRLTVWQ